MQPKNRHFLEQVLAHSTIDITPIGEILRKITLVCPPGYKLSCKPNPKLSLDLDKVNPQTGSLSRLLLRLFFNFDWLTFSKIASRDLDKYLFRSVILSLQVWQDLE